MKLKKTLALVLLAVLTPLFLFGKSKLVALTIGEITLEPDDSLTFSLQDEPEEVGGYEVLSEFLPTGVEVTWTGKKFKLPKAGKVKYSKKEEDFVTTSDENPCGLKLSVNKKTGRVKGSFKIYVAKSEKKLKTFSATVSGYVGEELTVTVKKAGSATATLE